jgi:cell division protease FtsH
MLAIALLALTVSKILPDTPVGAPAQAATKEAPMDASQLESLIKSNPQAIAKVTFLNGSGTVTVEQVGHKPVDVTVPAWDLGDLSKSLKTAGVPFDAKDPNAAKDFFAHWWPLLLIVMGLFTISMFARNYQMSRAMANPSDGESGMGRFMRAKEPEEKKKKEKRDESERVTFNDVAGCDEAVAELQRLINKNFTYSWIPRLFNWKQKTRGVLLVGPPGTGKTLLARALSWECGGTFESASGADFVEMFVGQGAARIRKLFARGRAEVKKTKKPHFIFIDEIDAVGGKRGGINHNDEREATLNALLVELDGVSNNNKNIFVIGATNRPDMLDDALLRPGRLGTQVQVDLPDVVGREKIWAIHLRNRMHLLNGVSTQALAESTYMYSGAEIMGTAEKATMIAMERFQEAVKKLEASGVSIADIQKQVHDGLLKPDITMHDFDDAKDCIKYGESMKSKQAHMGDDQKKQTSYHEAGHAVVSRIFEPITYPAIKATIMRRARALGYVQWMPTVDAVSNTREEALAKIIVLMAGRAAQEHFLQTVDTGASNDFQQATGLAQKMVASWGMTKIGPVSYGEGTSLSGYGSGQGNRPLGRKLGDRMDRETVFLVTRCYEVAKAIIASEETLVEEVAERLFKDETLLKHELIAIYDANTPTTKPDDLKIPYWKGARYEELARQ